MQKLTIQQIKEVYAYQAMKAKNLFLHNSLCYLEFPYYEKPMISIIMLTYNKCEYTFRCLESILAYGNIPYELILIDNASTDDTPTLYSRIKNVTTIINDENVFFIRGNNQGAALARAPYLLFLNNDTQISAGTLKELLQTIETEDKCGAVGGKLILQDGTIQEAGSIFWANGNNHEYCRGKDPLAAQCSFLREADYCGGACLLVRKDLFDQLGGFSREWEPAYYEETDLCTSIRKAGYRVLFQPASYVFHNENTSSSPEKADELCRRNSLKFEAKWRTYLESQGYNLSLGFGLYAEGDILRSRDRRKLNTLLIVVESINQIINGKIPELQFEKISSFAKQYKTTILSLSTSPEQIAVNSLERIGIEVFYGTAEFDSLNQERKKYYNDIIIFLSEKHLDRIQSIKQHYIYSSLVDLSMKFDEFTYE